MGNFQISLLPKRKSPLIPWGKIILAYSGEIFLLWEISENSENQFPNTCSIVNCLKQFDNSVQNIPEFFKIEHYSSFTGKSHTLNRIPDNLLVSVFQTDCRPFEPCYNVIQAISSCFARLLELITIDVLKRLILACSNSYQFNRFILDNSDQFCI